MKPTSDVTKGRRLNRETAWLTTLVLAVSIVGAWTFWSFRSEKQRHFTSGDTGATIPSASSEVEGPGGQSSVSPNNQPDPALPAGSAMPAEGVPLANAFEDLARLSSSGSSAASMRLFSDLTKCKIRAAQVAVINYYSYSPKVDGETAGVNETQELGYAGHVAKKSVEYLESTDQLCQGITAAQIDQRGEYLRKAALQNDREAIVCYATSYELGPKYLSDEWFNYASRWQQEAPYFAQKAFDLGQADILLPLIEALTPDDPTVYKTYRLSEVVNSNQQWAYALALLYQRLVPVDQLTHAQQYVARLSEGLHPEELAAAKNAADTLWPRFARSGGDKRVTRPCPEFIFPEIPS